MLNKLKAVKLRAILGSFFALGTIVMTPEFANPQNSPNNSQRRERIRVLSAILVPDGAVDYEKIAPNILVKGRYGLKAAQLIDPPSDLAEEVSIWKLDSGFKGPDGKPMPPDPNPDPETVTYDMISSTRYRGNGHTIYVTTARMGPAAMKFKHTFISKARLADGTEVGVTVACKPTQEVSQNEQGVPQSELFDYDCVHDSKTPNRVVFMRGNLIVSMASDLPIERVMELATRIQIK